MVSSHIKDVLLTNSPLSRTVLQSVCYNSGMSSSDNEAVLIASSPLPCSILELVIAGFPPMDAIHLLSVLGAQGSACVSDSSWTITIPVTPSGATLNLLNSSLVVPPGAVNATTDLTFTIMASMPQDLPNALGRIFEFGPDGTVFQVPITLSLAFSDAGHSGRSRELYNIRFYYFDEINDTWMPEQDPQIDWANRRLIVELSHFSRYAFAR
jgi:hypothetical protein